jgi:heparan-alpha-glucosaminide N-acetyltransferase
LNEERYALGVKREISLSAIRHTLNRNNNKMKQLPQRILSIDVLRAITMFLMIFVNDVSGVGEIPKWIEHTAADYDGMGFSDIIFPAFLCIVGLSLPFAINARLKKNESNFNIISYIVLRAIALIVMGFFHVNLENYNHEQAILSYPIFTLVLTLGFFLVWLDYADKINKTIKYGCIGLGILIITTMAYLYKGGNATHPQGLSPHWWGILGIIGWAYFFAAITYLFTKGKLKWLLPAFIIFALINITSHMDLLHINLWMIGDASSITLILGGAVISTVYKVMISKAKTQQLWIVLAEAGLLSMLIGFLIRPYTGGISKIYATPAWVFICLGISILMFKLLIYIVDFKGKRDWFKFISPAGTSTLTCYLMPYILYSLYSLIDFNYPHYLNYGFGGIMRSFFVAFLIIRIVALMEKKRIRLRV